MPHVGIGGGAADGEADDEDVGLGVGERAQAVVLLLARSVPEVQTDCPPIHSHLGTVVVKHSGDVLFWEGVGGVADEETRFSHRAISDHDTLYGLHSSPRNRVLRHKVLCRGVLSTLQDE